MLKNILISKVRIKLLEQFFFNPLEQYHVRGLVRILDEEINAIRRELLNLESASILRSEKQGNKIVYTVNYQNQFVSDLRDIVVKNSNLGMKFAKMSKELGNVSCILATTAFLTNSYVDENDIDFLFIGEIDVRVLANSMKQIESDLQKELRYTALTLVDFDFGKKKRTPVIINAISKDFVVIYGSLRQMIM